MLFECASSLGFLSADGRAQYNGDAPADDAMSVACGEADKSEQALESDFHIQYDEEDENEDPEPDTGDAAVDLELDGDGVHERADAQAKRQRLLEPSEEIPRPSDSAVNLQLDDASVDEAADAQAKRQMLLEPSEEIPRPARAVGGGGVKLHRSPHDILRPISPPGCLITLQKTDYRFKATWRRELVCDRWIDRLKNATYSVAFNLRPDSTATWQDSLRAVHGLAWDKWSLGHNFLAELRLPPGVEPQRPGVVPEEVFRMLQPIFDNMPARRKY